MPISERAFAPVRADLIAKGVSRPAVEALKNALDLAVSSPDALLKANNLSDLASAPTARTNLGLGTAATHAAGDFLLTADNLSDVPDPATARRNLDIPALMMMGLDGEDGADGPRGSPGVAGATGAPGSAGTSGPPGCSGEDGQDGMMGPPGLPGVGGSAGAAGPQGAIGFAVDGLDGEEGMPIPGPPGSAGAAGATGPAGAPGYFAYGIDGRDGEEGPPGPPLNLPIDLSSPAVTGNLGVSHLNSGSGANATSFWRGDGSWAAASTGGSATGIYEASSTKPLVAGFTWNNQGGATGTDGTAALIMTAGATGNIRSLEQNTPTAPFDCYIRCRNLKTAAQNDTVGFVLRNSTNSRLILYGIYNDLTTAPPWVLGQRWTNNTSFSATIINSNAAIGGFPVLWYRVNVTSTTITFYYSCDGWDWTLIGTETILTFLTAAGGGTLDKIGIGLCSIGAPEAHFYTFSFTAPA